MTQSRPVKKKKKAEKKTQKCKDDETKGNATRPSSPVDKRKVAANNVREMIKEAHKMHKIHTRSLKGLSTPTSKDTIGKPKAPEKPTVESSNDGRYLSIEMTKTSSKTIKGRMEENTSVIQMKTRRRLSEEMAKNKGPSRKGSNESDKKKIEIVSGRCGSTEFQAKKNEAVSRGGSVVFPVKRRIDVTQRQGSVEFPAEKKEVGKTRGSSRNRRESLLKIKDYQVGSFVSLELLDKMKCHESDMCIRSRKSILRQSRADAQKPKETLSKTSDGNSKKLRKDEKRKKDDGVSEKKSSSLKTTGEKKRRVKKGSSPKRERVDSESAPVKRESIVISQTKSVVSRPKSASSNLDSNISSITGAGDLFSSNTSRSYFSSESDISKIDKKFMQILEAVTQTKIGFEERAKQMAAEPTNDGDLPSTSKNDDSETKKREPSELEQKLMDRINYLEQKLEKSKSTVQDPVENKNETENIVVGHASSKSGVEKLWAKENDNDSQEADGDRKLKNDEALKAEKASKLKERSNIREAPQLPKPTRKRQEAVTEVKSTNNSENVKGRGNECSRQETAIKKHGRDDSKQTNSKQVSEKGGERPETTTAAATEDEKNGYKRVETWSIIKRLEKAFQTLGLNLEDLDNSDEENSSAKKKLRGKKCELSGQEKRGLPQSETLRRCQEAAHTSESSEKKIAHASRDTQFVVETNGSGDKNTEYKRMRSSRKTEDLAKSPKEKNSKDKTQKETYYASVKLTPRVRISEGCDLNGLPDGKHVESIKRKAPKKRSVDSGKETTEHGIFPKKSKPATEEQSFKRCGKRQNFEDGRIRHGKSKSECSLSVSCSASSLSDDSGVKSHKRKKNQSLVRETYMRDREVWTKTNGKGDAMPQHLLPPGKKMDHVMQPEKKWSGETLKRTNVNGVQATMKKTHEILKMEEESDELELKQIRQRHRQIISEIKLSLEEIKKQHNLCTRLRRQTKQFNRDCHAKRRMLTSYLKDVETSYERRNGRHKARDINPKHSRALSTDSYYYTMEKNSKLRGKFSDCNMQMARLQERDGKDESGRETCELDDGVLNTIETDNETSTVSEVLSSIVLEHTSTELALTDTAEESYRSMTSSLHTVCRSYKPKRYAAAGEGITSMEMLCLQWEGDENPTFSEDGVKQAPSYLVQLLQKLNKIIVTEKNQLEDLVVKASASSNRSTQSNKTRLSLSAKSSDSSLHREQHHKSSVNTRPATTEYEICSANLASSGLSRQHKSKGNKKSGRDKSPEMKEGIPVSRSKSFRSDPGGHSFDSLLDQEMVISESHPINRTDTISQCGKSCIHLEKHAEEHRYRKGDPSFRSQAHILQQLGEHSRHCLAKLQENDDSWKRKLEVERILRVNEKMFKRTTSFGRDTGTHALDYDPYITAKGRQVSHARHRQQSMIIDHNRGEENEESQTVLGHASRHSGVAFGIRKHDRKAPHEYLKADRKSESSRLGRHHEAGKKGKRHHLEEIPINFCEVSANTAGSSAARLKDAYCQTDNIDEYDDIGDIYLLEESGSSPSFN